MSTSRFESDAFTIDLPEGWEERQDRDGWEFLHPSGQDQVMLTVVSAKRAMSLEEAKAALARTLEARQHALREVSQGLAILAPVRSKTSDKGAAVSLVEPLAGEASLAGQRRHAAGLGDGREGGGDEGRVLGRLLEAGLPVESDVLLRPEVGRRIPPPQPDLRSWPGRH